MRRGPVVLITAFLSSLSGMAVGILLVSCGKSLAVYENAEDPCKKRGPDVCISDAHGDYHCSHDKEE